MYDRTFFLKEKKIRITLNKYSYERYFVDELIFRKNVRQKIIL